MTGMRVRGWRQKGRGVDEEWKTSDFGDGVGLDGQDLRGIDRDT